MGHRSAPAISVFHDSNEVKGVTEESVTASTQPDPVLVALKPFLERNPECEYRKRPRGHLIVRPWGDPTLELRVPDDRADIIDALNTIRLTPRFSALWHIDTHDLEVIWTPFRVDPAIRARAFDFGLADHLYRCEFGDSSQRLALVGEVARPVVKWNLSCKSVKASVPSTTQPRLPSSPSFAT